MRTSVGPLGFVVVGITWIYFLLMATLGLNAVGFIARFLVLCRWSNVLRSGVILALQSSEAVHLGVGNLNVVRHVRRIMAGKDPEKPCELLVDGDLLFLARSLVSKRAWVPVPFLMLRVTQMMRWFAAAGFVRLTRLVMTERMKLLTSVGVGLLLMSLTAGRALVSHCV